MSDRKLFGWLFSRSSVDWTEQCRDELPPDVNADFPFDDSETLAEMVEDWGAKTAEAKP